VRCDAMRCDELMRWGKRCVTFSRF
jgi:hypothetical protein